MPAKSKAQFRLMKAIEHDPKIAKKFGMSQDVAAEYTSSNIKGKSYGKLPETKTAKKSGGGVSLSVGRGEKLPTKQGAGLTAKGRAKANKATGSHLKAPAPHPKTKKDEGRKKSFCARMSGVVKDAKGDRKSTRLNSSHT